MSLPKPKPSAYFNRRKVVLDNWDSYPVRTQRYFIRNNEQYLGAAKRKEALLEKFKQKRNAPKKPRPVLNPETAARNKAAHEQARKANESSADIAQAQRMVSGWKDENGKTIPKTVHGIQLHQEFVAYVRRNFTGIRLNHLHIQLRYKNIHAAAERAKKQAAYDAYHKKAAAKRERERIARVKAIAKESRERAESHRRASIRQAQRQVRTAVRKIAFWERRISLLWSYINRDEHYIERIEPKLPGWKGTSLYFAMKRNVAKAKVRWDRRLVRLKKHERYLASARAKLKDAEMFLSK